MALSTLYARHVPAIRDRSHAPHRLEACVTLFGLTLVPQRSGCLSLFFICRPRRCVLWIFLTILGAAQGLRAPDRFKCFQAVFSDGNLIVAAAVAADPPYNADLSGKADSSGAIQRAMGDVAAHGGGTVYLPPGRYRLEKSLSIPATVTLCGEWRKPKPGQPLFGTILLAYAGKGESNGPALISPPECGHAYVYNLTIYYPEQSPESPIPYPFSIEGRVAYVHNITLVNSYQGILMSNFSGSNVSGIYGTALKRGVVLKSSCELCSCSQVRLNSDYWAQLPEARMTGENAVKLRELIMRELVAVQIGKVDGFSFYDADIEESHFPVLVKLEDDEQKVMVAPRSNYGFGGGMAKVRGCRTEIEGAWYFGTHYFDLDNYSQLAAKNYVFAPRRQAARSGRESIYQSADFGVRADGSTDDSVMLQSALNHAAKAGGGTVLLPRGTTFLGRPITVPSGVELRGGLQGVVIRPWYNVSALRIGFGNDTPDPDNAHAAISLEEGAGLRGLCICHALNVWETNERGDLVIHPYPYAIRSLGREVYVNDITLTNAYNGIDFGAVRSDASQVVNLWGAIYRYGIHVGANSDSVHLENVNIDIGPLGDFQLNQPPGPPAQDKRRMWQHYLDDHAVNYLFGDCTNLHTFHLAGFAPHRFMDFMDQGSGGCRDAEFWSSIFDVPQVETARFRAGGRLAFYGVFVTGGGNHRSLWAEFDKDFKGSVDVFGLSQQLTFNNRPYDVGPEKFQIHLERSLTTVPTVVASSFVTGHEPEKALDGNPRTMWQSGEGSGPHLLAVELARPSIVTRWRLHNAGTFTDRRYNTSEAELEGSADGKNYVKLAGFANNTADWVDVPVECKRPVRFVRVRVIKGQEPKARENRSSIAGFDVFGYPCMR